jgi:tRNA-dihydrouridine synthase A
VSVFYLHARKAWLNGLSPKENRIIPPLDYERARRLAMRRSDLSVIMNGGLESANKAVAEMQGCDGVMIGRAAYRTPYMLTEMAQRIFGRIPPRREHLALAMAKYAETTTKTGVPLHSITRHMLGLYAGQPGAKYWRRQLGENARKAISPGDLIRETSAVCEELAARRAA